MQSRTLIYNCIFLGCEIGILRWCLGSILGLFGNDCLHLGESVVKPGLFELHLQVVNSAHLQPRDEPSGVPLNCHGRFQNDLLNILSLLSQCLNLAMHRVGILAQFHLCSQLLLLQLLKQLSLPIHRPTQLCDFLGRFGEMGGWRGQDWVRIQIVTVASTWCAIAYLSLRTGRHRLQTPSRSSLSWASRGHIPLVA